MEANKLNKVTVWVMRDTRLKLNMLAGLRKISGLRLLDQLVSEDLRRVADEMGIADRDIFNRQAVGEGEK